MMRECNIQNNTLSFSLVFFCFWFRVLFLFLLVFYFFHFCKSNLFPTPCTEYDSIKSAISDSSFLWEERDEVMIRFYWESKEFYSVHCKYDYVNGLGIVDKLIQFKCQIV